MTPVNCHGGIAEFGTRDGQHSALVHNGLLVSYFEGIPEAKGVLFRKRIYKHQIMPRYKFSKYLGRYFLHWTRMKVAIELIKTIRIPS